MYRDHVKPMTTMRTGSLILLTLTLACAKLTAEDWPHWQGLHRNGKTSETSGWNGNDWLGQEPAWSADVGAGGTSPVVADGKLYVLGWRDGQDTLSCLDARTGRPLWTHAYACPQHSRNATGDEGLYSGPTSTPEFDPATGILYTLSCDGDLHAWDTRRDDKLLWSHRLLDEFDVPQRPRVGRQGRRDYGYTTAPLVVGDRLLVEVGAKTANTVALDKRTGKQLWISENKDPAGHTGGLVPMTVDGLECVAVFTIRNLVVFRLDGAQAGKTLAEYPWYTDFANSVATPAVQDNHVLITSEYNHGTICKLEISRSGARKLWEAERASKVCTPLIHAGHVYWSWSKLVCLDWQSGDVRWEGGQTGDAGSCILTADNRLIVWCAGGKLMLVETAARAPQELKVLAQREGLASSDVWPHVVLANRFLYLKDRNGNLKAFQLP